MTGKYLLNAFVLVATSIFLVSTAVAGSTFKSHAVLKTDYQNLDWIEGKLTMGSAKGVFKIYGSSSALIPNGERSEYCLMHVVKMDKGTDILTNCTVTDKDGDVLYSVSERKHGEIGIGGKGKTNFIGGTGKYKGASGVCDYTANYVPENWISVDFDCKMQ